MRMSNNADGVEGGEEKGPKHVWSISFPNL
jgi:hypothetical protein